MRFRNAVDPDLAAAYRTAGWWGDVTLVDHLRSHVAARPDARAYVSDAGMLSWRQLDAASARVAHLLVATGHAPGDRVAVLIPDGATVHAVMLGLEKAGAVLVGLGGRAGIREIAHVVGATGARTLLMPAAHRDRAAADLHRDLAELGTALEHIAEIPQLETDPEAAFVVDGERLDEPPAADLDARRIQPDDLSIINSTSGTTGLPKCVLHTQNRWMYFHQLAARNGELTSADVFMSAVPAPFGFGLWTSHFTPIILGTPTVVHRRFDSTATLGAIERERVSVLACVSTQFLMLLNDPALDDHDLSSLRVMFTGGEAVPAARAMEFERRTGCTVLQFYGSNETGVLSGTRTTDPTWVRFETAGRIEPDMQVRMYDRDGREQIVGEGRPACRGPATCLGYLDREANDQLYTEDGWMLMGDLCTIDADGLLRVTGRTSDIIIRGGKNISASQVEDEVMSHPAVALAAAVAWPDDVFGERVCAFVELADGAAPITLDELADHLRVRGTSVELIPEHLAIMESLPRSSGAKVAKGRLRDLVRERAAPDG